MTSLVIKTDNFCPKCVLRYERARYLLNEAETLQDAQGRLSSTFQWNINLNTDVPDNDDPVQV